MPWLAPRLPLRVPIPEVIGEAPLVVRHVLVPGDPITALTADHGVAMGKFLVALHHSPVPDAVGHGLVSAEETRHERVATLGRFRKDVVPLVPTSDRAAALAILDAAQDFPADTVVHGDLGPEHILTDGEHLTGVIDFGDAHVGDTAIDLAWMLYGTPPEFAEAVTATCEVTDALRTRALVWHQLGPWYEVLYGMDTDDATLVHSGVAGLVDRLSPPGP